MQQHNEEWYECNSGWEGGASAINISLCNRDLEEGEGTAAHLPRWGFPLGISVRSRCVMRLLYMHLTE